MRSDRAPVRRATSPRPPPCLEGPGSARPCPRAQGRREPRGVAVRALPPCPGERQGFCELHPASPSVRRGSPTLRSRPPASPEQHGADRAGRPPGVRRSTATPYPPSRRARVSARASAIFTPRPRQAIGAIRPSDHAPLRARSSTAKTNGRAPPRRGDPPTCLRKADHWCPARRPVLRGRASQATATHRITSLRSGPCGPVDAGAGPVGPPAPAPQRPRGPWPAHDPDPTASRRARKRLVSDRAPPNRPRVAAPRRATPGRHPGRAAASSAWASTGPARGCRSPRPPSSPCRPSRRAACACPSRTSRRSRRRG